MTGAAELTADIRRLAGEALLLTIGGAQERAVREAIQRLDEPLRVALAGRTKAGKSTLLNALVGERLAATDAGECTRIVTWYRRDRGYRVVARIAGSGERDLRFDRADGVLDFDLGGLDWQDVEQIDVGWPSDKLATMTLIDTPGLTSVDARVSARTSQALLDDDAGGARQADAVIYLMRHLHRYDTEFLEAFVDRSLAHASPINSIVVLSRADEIGSARPDALDSARAVAARYAGDRRVRELASTVLPVAGLLAETGATLREDQFGWLRELAALDEPRRRDLLRSVDRFRDPGLNPLGEAIRDELLERLGLFGLRQAIPLLVGGQVRTATDLSRALLDMSGIAELQRLLNEQFTARSSALKARSALAALRGVADDLRRRAVPGATELEADLERLEIGSQELALLRLAHIVLAGLVQVTPAERAELELLIGGRSAGERVGLTTDAAPDAVRAAAIAGLERWRGRVSSPLSDRSEIEAADIIVRAYEQIHANPEKA